jgi:hypothetical protein
VLTTADGVTLAGTDETSAVGAAAVAVAAAGVVAVGGLAVAGCVVPAGGALVAAGGAVVALLPHPASRPTTAVSVTI